MNSFTISAVIVFVIVAFLVPLEKEITLKPLGAEDSDGKSLGDIISPDYLLDLKTYPYGYMQINSWETVDDVLDARIEAAYKTNSFGAGNIYFGYFIDGWNETGPFMESGNITHVVMNLPKSGNLGNVSFRFRGEDTDFGIDAMSWVKAQLIVKKRVYGFLGMLI